MTGMRPPSARFCSQSHTCGLSTSPAQTTRSSREWSIDWSGAFPYRISIRTAVGDVKMPVTPNSSTAVRQLASACG